jgi:apolipoprotein N-acyltransferase
MRGMLVRLCGAVLSALLLAIAFPLTLPDMPHWLGVHIPQSILPGFDAAQGYAQWPWAAFFALIPLFEVARTSRRPAEAFWFGYLAGVIWLLLSLDWLGSFGLLPVILLALYFALPTAAFAWVAHLMLHRLGAGYLLPGLPAVWTAIEYLRQFGFWAFPWNLLGYSQAHNLPLIQVADLGGVCAVSFIIVLANVGLFFLLSSLAPLRWRIAYASIAAVVLLWVLIYGETKLVLHPLRSADPGLQLALIQGGLETLSQWDAEMLAASLRQYMPPTEAAVSRWEDAQLAEQRWRNSRAWPWPEEHLLVVWPESVLPLAIDPRHLGSLPYPVQRLVQSHPGMALLMGAHGQPHKNVEFENGCLLISAIGTPVWPYSKVRLVPYGETVPFRGVARFLNYPWGNYDLTEGRSLAPLEWDGYRLGLMVCFDNAWSFVAREQVKRGAGVLVLVTNNSWYALHSGIRQHCDIDVLRAVECRRPLARCSTTGWSHIVDAYGRILQTTSVGGAGVVDGGVTPGRGLTVYALAGDLFSQLCLVFAAALLVKLLLNAPAERFL